MWIINSLKHEPIGIYCTPNEWDGAEQSFEQVKECGRATFLAQWGQAGHARRHLQIVEHTILRRCTWTSTIGQRSLIRSATTTGTSKRSWESSVEWHAATFQSLTQGSSLATSSCCTTSSWMYSSSRMEPPWDFPASMTPSTSVNQRLDSFLPTVFGDLRV